MKFSCATKELKTALAVASKAVNPKSPLPILSHLLLEVGPQTLSITGFDLDTGVTITIPADVQETGGVTMPAAQLTSLIGLAGSKTVEVSRISEGRIGILAEGSSKIARWELNSLPAEEYPSIPALDGLSVVVPAAIFGNAIEEAAVAVAPEKDESRRVMTGLYIGAVDGVLTCVGCDGRRLAVAQRSIDYQGEMPSVVVPMRTVAALAKALGSAGDVRIFLTRGRAFFEHENKRWFASLLEGRFPDWVKVMPNRDIYPWVAKIGRKDLVEAVKGALAMAKEEKTPGLLVFSFDEYTVKVTSNTASLGEAAISMECEGEGGDTFPPYGVNGNYLLDALLAIESESILWELQTETTSSILRPDDDITFRYVVMPVKLRDVAEEFEKEAAAAR
jgi:DNA polymerase III subunit beta